MRMGDAHREEAAKRRDPVTREAVARYKTVLKSAIERRPSGLRGRLAEAMGKNRSFVSQITNPAYETPVPARHLETIFRIVHISAEEKAAFLAAYAEAHPERRRPAERGARTRRLVVEVPDLGDEARNLRVERLLRDLAAQLTKIMAD